MVLEKKMLERDAMLMNPKLCAHENFMRNGASAVIGRVWKRRQRLLRWRDAVRLALEQRDVANQQIEVRLPPLISQPSSRTALSHLSILSIPLLRITYSHLSHCYPRPNAWYGATR